MSWIHGYHLVTLRVRSSRDVARLRDKVMQLGRACGVAALDTTRLATAASDLARYMLDLGDDPPEVRTRLGLVGGTDREHQSVAGIRMLLDREAGPTDDDPPADDEDSVSESLVRNLAMPDDGESSWTHWRGPVPEALQAAASLLDDLVLDPADDGTVRRTSAVRWVEGADLAGLVKRVADIRDRLFEGTADDYLENLQAKQQQLERLLRESVTANERLERANRELERANAVKNRFLGIAAHDLRNPLHNILMATDILAMPQSSDEERQEVTGMVRESADSMLRLINDLLDVSRIESGVVTIDPSRVELGEYIRDTVEPMHAIAARKSITIRLELEEAPQRTVLDSDRVGQVIANLVDNAVKYSPRGTTVTVRAAADAPIDGWRLEVLDEGPGIAAEDQPRLFEAFHRGRNRPTAGEPSTGLGLSICRMLIEAHGGTISATNRTTGGSCFCVRLPSAPPDRTG